jgi:uncharacterized membrane protein YbhN (UPF0104 family)
VSQNWSSCKKWLLRAAKVLIVVLLLWFVRRTLTDAWNKLDEYPWHPHFGWLVLSGLAYLLGLLPAALFWYRVLRVMGQRPRLGETIRAYYIGHLGKYVPGKALVIILRAGLIRSHRVDTAVAAASVFVETLTLMAVGAFWAAAILAVRFREQRLLLLIAIGLMLASGLPTVPVVFRHLARLAGVGRSDPTTSDKLHRLGRGTLALGWVLMSISWGILALSLWLVLKGIGVEDATLVADFPLYTAAVSLAMVAGFVSFIPGGAFVRELVLGALMLPRFGDVVAVVSALLLRVVWLVSELVISGILYVCGLRAGRPQPSNP